MEVGRSMARKGLLALPSGWAQPQLWAGSTYALWTPTSSVVPLMPFLTLGSSFPFSEPQFLCLENGKICQPSWMVLRLQPNMPHG